ncbi:MAG: hypothetical protein C4521_10490 [Actinobacteria bacterium]|nr:MAG: hypothetical protein C4521_10490 [Actinomycetota bacterium]
MECPNCGSDLADDAKFCSLCFTRFDGASQAVSPTGYPAPDSVSPSDYAAPGPVSPEGQSGSAPIGPSGYPVREDSLPPEIPADELARIKSFSSNEGLPSVPARPEATVGRKVAVVAGGALLIVILGQILNYLPIPFVGLLAPFLGAAMVGYLLREEGGRYGLIAAAIPAALGAIVVWIVSASLIGPMTTQAASQSKANLPAGALADALSGIIWFAVVIGVGSNCLAGYFGGWVGENYADRIR